MSQQELFERYKRDLRPETCDDLIVLKEPTDTNITDILKNRFENDNIYTYLGSTLVSVNPYKKTNHYGSDIVNFFHTHQPYSVAPHLYSLAEDAFRTMKETGVGQTVIISGESGAGKTEAARIMMDYLAKVSVSGLLTENIKRIILGSNDVLEAFGNAKTLRNDNSSRFGRFVDMFYNFKGHMEGAHITTSLLEKSRVVSQREGERNFHIFYQLCEGADDYTRKQLFLDSPKNFKYLCPRKGADIIIKGSSDKEAFKVTQHSMTEAGISMNERIEIFRVLAGILHLGNLEFKEETKDNKDSATIANNDSLKYASLCLQVDAQVLKDCILFRTMKIGKETIKQTQPPAKAMFNRDALAKGIYERLFQWLIRRINAAVKRPDDARFTIGLLDLYGFEIYEKPDINSLDQLNINYVNEKLQEQIQRWLMNEQNEYVHEDVPWKMKNFDMSGVEETLRVIESKPLGLYSLLDEESLMPKGNDENYLAKVKEAFHEKSSAFESSRFKGLNFALNHFACKVTYDVTDWVEKNRDTLFEDLILAMRSSNSDLMKQLFPKDERIALGGKMQTTTSQQFQSDVRGLIGKLANKKHLYVKCIKPNHKKNNNFDESVVIDQVKYLGVSGNVFVRKAGYHFKMPYEEFLDRYKLCCDATWPTWRGTSKAGCQEILKEMKVPKHMFALGKNKIFLRSPIQLAALDEKVESRKVEMATLIQKNYRRYKTRQTTMEQQHLAKALGVTFNEKEFLFKETLSTINLNGQRERRLFVLTKDAAYLLCPKTFAVLRRIPYNRMNKLCCSALNDGVFNIEVPKTYDCLVEADNKHQVMKAIREAYEANMKKQMKVEISEQFKFRPTATKLKTLKFAKNDDVKVAMIESSPDGLVISIKPSDDAFDGKKLRRKNSIHKKYYGDYVHLQNSDWFKQMQADYGDQYVSFSSIVSKYNKNYRKQERLLVVTDRAVYNLDPNGYITKRRIEMRRVRGLIVSPLTDGFFILRIPDEYDYVFESSKKTEILKCLQDNYAGATRGNLACDIKEEISYKADRKAVTDQIIKFKAEKGITQTSIMKKPYGADVLVKMEETITNDMTREVVQDIYQGQKLRRRESLLSSQIGDYLHIGSSKHFAKLCQKYGDTQLVYSGGVSKINHRYQVQERKIIITDDALYNMDKEAKDVKRRIPIKKIAGISVSTMRDGFFIVRVPDEYDYFFESPNKTEIIKALCDNYKRLKGTNLDLAVDDKQFYSAFKVSKGKGVRTIDFQEDNTVLQSTLYPTSTGLMIKVNNKEETEERLQQQEFDVVTQDSDIYQGRKIRRKESASKERLGNYILDMEHADIKKLFRQNGDKQLLFSAEMNKINKKYASQKRIVVVTDKNVYNLDPKDFKVKRKIALDEIDAVSVSTLPDGMFCMHMPESYDYVFESDKKTELIDVLATAIQKKANKKMTVNVSDKFEFQPSKGEFQSINFVLDDSAGQTTIEGATNGLVVHVQHDEPAVTLEAAYVYYNDNQQNPIEVKPEPILIKFKKRWKYKLEIRFYVNEHLQGCSFHEKIDTVTSRQEFVSQVADLKPRDERYIVTLPERRVIFSLLSKTQVKAKLVDPVGKTLLAIRFVYDVR